MKRKILLLGGTGFIGSELLNILNQHSETNDVALLAHHNVPYRRLEQQNLYVGDLRSFDLEVIRAFNPDVIVHMARLRGKGRLGRWLSARQGARANERIIRYLIKNRLKPHVFYVSGTLVYGDCGEHLVTEDFPHRPTAYAREYIQAEKPWMKALEKNTLPVSILCPPWIMGDRSWFSSFYLRSMIDHGTIPQFGDGKNWMSLLDVEDCAGLIYHALTRAKPGRYYNLGQPDNHVQLKDFVGELSRVTGLPTRQFSKGEILSVYGKTIWQAFTFSLKTSTLYPDLVQSYHFKYPDLSSVILHNLQKSGWFQKT